MYSTRRDCLLRSLLFFSVINILIEIKSKGTIHNFKIETPRDEFYKLAVTNSPGQAERLKLEQLDPVEVGHVYKMKLEPGKFYEIRTASVKPPLFLIPHFLTPDECARIQSSAKSKGLHASRILRRNLNDLAGSNRNTYYNTERFRRFDEDNSQFLDVDEAQRALGELEGISGMQRNTFRGLVDSVVDLDSDRELSIVEFQRIPYIITKILDWVAAHGGVDVMSADEIKTLEAGPPRVSHQVWMSQEDYDPSEAIRRRLSKLTGVHPDIIKTSERLQVVRYKPGGHFHAHHDSNEIRPHEPCIHTEDSNSHDEEGYFLRRRLCRYMTVMYYLVEPEEGGETAFPAADNVTYSTDKIVRGNRTIDPINLTHHCEDASLHLRPEKGMAVMWYNHHVDSETGWIGDLDQWSLHGGCEVIKGEKWIANNWINVDNNYDRQIRLHHRKLHVPPSHGLQNKGRTEASSNWRIPGSLSEDD